MRRASALLVVLLLGVASLAHVFADDDKPTPKFDRLNRDEIRVGAMSTLRALGTNFGDTKDGISVLASGETCKILVVEPSAISFQMPVQSRARTVPIEIDVRGARFHTRVRARRFKPSEISPEPPQTRNYFVHVKSVDVSHLGSSTLVATVLTDLPPNCLVSVSLVSSEGISVHERNIKRISHGRDMSIEHRFWEVDVRFFDFAYLAPGAYVARVDFRLDRQDGLAWGDRELQALTASERRAIEHLSGTTPFEVAPIATRSLAR